MKVLHVTPDYPPDLIGGIGMHVDRLHQSLIRAGVDSRVVSTWPTDRAGQTVRVAPVFGPTHECGDKPLANMLFELQKAAGVAVVELGGFVPDVIHAHDYRAIIGAQALAYRHNARLVITKHSMHPLIKNPNPADLRRALFYQYVDELQRAGFSNADAVILVSNEMRNSVDSYKSELSDNTKLHVIPNGVDIPDRDNYGPRIPGRIVFVGRLDRAKGADLLVEALHVLDDSTASAIEVHFFGRGSLAESLEKRARQLDTHARVEFHGFVPPEHISEILSTAEFCVVPSRYDAYPLVTLEAMAAATPLIASNTGGIPAQLGAGERGLLVDCEDAQSLAEGISYAISHRSDMNARAMAARQWVARNCSWHEIANQTVSLYRSITLDR
ncbi:MULTISPECIES: glycosyltransferase family 4 protein [Actinomyces]|uniref:Glycosyltransferase family 4 protein n=1 Tax=Actinomyces respiraculi TaxID=2744574 RepID=A0A7T0PY05_9ACTO|nr:MULTISPECIES: glycosyltransferase family 4 protein [Actinomyces]QPL06175.1 glycosyltransferase family 4 protein [Actinomyces respiraculi]